MVEYLKNNSQLFIIFLVWLLVGSFAGPLFYILIPLTIFLFRKNEMYFELFIGFWFILILSDNLTYSWIFAKKIKDIYLVLLSLLFFLDIKNFIPLNTIFKKFVPFFIIALIALFFSETPSVSFQKTLSYGLFFLVIPNYFIRIYRTEGEMFLKKLIYFIVLILFISVILRFVDPTNAISHGGRLRGLFGNPNGLGLFSMLSFLVTYLIISLRPNLLSRDEKRFVYIFIIIPLFMSGSRNVATALTLFLLLSSFYKISSFFGFIIFLTFILLYEILDSNYIVIIKSLGLESFFRLETIEVGGGRYIAWKFAWEKIQQNLVLGKGIGFDEYIMRKNYRLLSKLGHQGGVHNSYLILWLNTGIVGLVAYFSIFISHFIQGAKRTKLAFPIMFAILFTINFEPWIAASLNPLTIILMFILVILTDDSFQEKIKEIDEKEV